MIWESSSRAKVAHLFSYPIIQDNDHTFRTVQFDNHTKITVQSMFEDFKEHFITGSMVRSRESARLPQQSEIINPQGNLGSRALPANTKKHNK